MTSYTTSTQPSLDWPPKWVKQESYFLGVPVSALPGLVEAYWSANGRWTFPDVDDASPADAGATAARFLHDVVHYWLEQGYTEQEMPALAALNTPTGLAKLVATASIAHLRAQV